ncbi:MAG: NADH-quinone oxidoreductase subunit K [Polyangiaceae bacterium]|nr:NADH-quinone oxidoreductase subunit K [Polyangiaceae bacterium]MCW5789468.1 NADH-quinone oxidoreductase subunit K [Polyangiaceae bacterium]
MTNQLDTALLVVVLTSAAIYLCLSRELVRSLFGFLLLSNAANLVVLSVSGDPSGRRAASVGEQTSGYVDPLPQALILTAIVIGFSVAAYLTVLIYRTYVDAGDGAALTLEEPPVVTEGGLNKASDTNDLPEAHGTLDDAPQRPTAPSGMQS